MCYWQALSYCTQSHLKEFATSTDVGASRWVPGLGTWTPLAGVPWPLWGLCVNHQTHSQLPTSQPLQGRGPWVPAPLYLLSRETKALRTSQDPGKAPHFRFMSRILPRTSLQCTEVAHSYHPNHGGCLQGHPAIQYQQHSKHTNGAHVLRTLPRMCQCEN